MVQRTHPLIVLVVDGFTYHGGNGLMGILYLANPSIATQRPAGK